MRIEHQAVTRKIVMRNTFQLNPLALVDIAITNSRNAGHEPDHDQIELFWKIARGEVTAPELQQIMTSKSDSTRLRNESLYGHLSCQDVDIVALKNKLTGVIKSLSTLS